MLAPGESRWFKRRADADAAGGAGADGSGSASSGAGGSGASGADPAAAGRWGRSYGYDRDVRDLVACGAACGVCTAFRAPVGGVLFAMEMSTR